MLDAEDKQKSTVRISYDGSFWGFHTKTRKRIFNIESTMCTKANSWWPARIPKLTERRQMLKERQSQIFEVGIEFSVT